MTTPQSPADQLRAAAQLIGEQAEAARHSINTDRYWADYDPSTAWRDGVTNGFGGPTSPWIALMHPGVGEALAAWLEREAAIWDALEVAKAELHPKGFKLSWGINTHAEALAVARAVLEAAQ